MGALDRNFAPQPIGVVSLTRTEEPEVTCPSLFWSRARSFAFERDDLRAFTGAPAQRLLETNGTAVLSQQIGERFVGEFLERFHAVGRKQIELVPGFVVKLYAFADHGWRPWNDNAEEHSLRFGP